MSTYLVVREFPYWAIGESLPKARANFKRVSGKFPTKKASIVAFTGELSDLENLQIDDVMGDILYSKRLIRSIIQ